MHPDIDESCGENGGIGTTGKTYFIEKKKSGPDSCRGIAPPPDTG